MKNRTARVPNGSACRPVIYLLDHRIYVYWVYLNFAANRPADASSAFPEEKLGAFGG